MKKKTNSKLTIYKLLLVLLLFLIIAITMLIIKKYGLQEEYEQRNQKTVEVFNKTEEKTDENGESMLEFEGYKVIGIIKIPAIDLEYPIIDRTTKETMLKSISRFWGGDINSYSNVCLAGHNNKITLTMFGKNKNLKNGDSIFLTDLTGLTIEYKIYDSFITDPDDVKILQTSDSSVREVTLITCTNGRANRLITKAREIK